jgi:formate dehydrogenase maturation protein FdhE
MIKIRMVSEIDSKILKKLDDWEKGSPPGPVELYIRLIRVQIDSKSDITIKVPLLSPEVISDRLSSHKPLLSFDELDIEWTIADKIFREALSIIGEYSDSATPASDFPLKETARAWYESNPLPKTGIDRDTLRVAIHTAMKPFLSMHAEALLPEVDQKRWRQGYCPICGSRPNFSFLSKDEEGARWLVCPRCDAQWLFQRLECPFCGNKEQKKLSYLTDDNGLYRLYLCEECKSYLKSIDLRIAEPDVLLPLEWVATLDLDRQACESGYSAGDVSLKKKR